MVSVMVPAGTLLLLYWALSSIYNVHATRKKPLVPTERNACPSILEVWVIFFMCLGSQRACTTSH